MKAERRQELKHNELADWLGERMETLKPHVTGVLLGIVLLGVILVGSTWYFSGQKQKASLAWSRYFEAFNDREPQKSLEGLTADPSGSTAGWWALLTLGDMELGQGAALLYSDRVEAQKHLDQAKSSYSRVEAAEDPLLKTRARLGLAKVYESMFKTEDAIKYYELVAESEKASAIGKSAAAAAQRLKSKGEAEFIEWFAKQTPKRPAPMPGMGGSIPGLPGDLPSRPDIGLPQGLLEGAGASTTGSVNPGTINAGTVNPGAVDPGTVPPAPPLSLPPPSETTPGANPGNAADLPTAPAATDPASAAKPAEPAEPKSDAAPQADAAAESTAEKKPD